LDDDDKFEDRHMRHPDARHKYENSYKNSSGMTSELPEVHNIPSRNSRPRRKLGFARMIMFLFSLILIASIAYGGYIINIVAKISTNSWQLGPLSTDSSGRTNVLLLGVGDPGHAGQNLSDTIMVVSINSNLHRIAQVSIPRDLRVDIPGYGVSKINAANADGGPGLAEQVVSNTLDSQMDYYVQTDFTGLKDIVDAVGGVDINVQDRLVDPEYPCDNNQYAVCGLDIEPGLQHMNGTKALQYVRCRKGTCGNDFGRAARQQQLIVQLKPKILNLGLLLQPAKLSILTSAIQKSIKTDLGLIQLLEIANDFRTDNSNPPVQLVLSTSPGGLLTGDPEGTSDLLPIGGDFSNISKKFQSIFIDSSLPATQ
jgi:polyisoprenyl-teichoic acid--peptidoglycan teichoic acid transferase